MIFKLSLALLSSAALAAELRSAKAEKIEGSFIVVFNKGVSEERIASHKELLLGQPKATIDRHYSIGEHFTGYAATLDKSALQFVLASSDVAYVEEDAVVRTSDLRAEKKATCVKQEEATWGLVRTSERALKINGEYQYEQESAGQGVTSYIIDTGIYLQHSEFEGRASWGVNTVDRDDSDGNGHGTHVAGTVGGKIYGIAKKCDLVAVKVLSASGSGSTAGVISGVDWVASNAKKPATSNLSLGGGKSSAMNAAIAALSKSGVVTVVAAGNENQNACNVSPASEPEAITVASSTNTDARSSFSNWGTCCNIFAPGSSITAAWINSPTSINTISGTSMAAPHVAGVATKYLSTNKGATVQQVKTWLDDNASEGEISNPNTGTPNKLVFSDCSVTS